MIFDYFDKRSVILRFASPAEVVRARGSELDPADRDALHRHKYVVIYDGTRQRICHVGFLKEDAVGEIDRRLRQLRW